MSTHNMLILSFKKNYTLETGSTTEYSNNVECQNVTRDALV